MPGYWPPARIMISFFLRHRRCGAFSQEQGTVNVVRFVNVSLVGLDGQYVVHEGLRDEAKLTWWGTRLINDD